jgi:signal transduction histidine kinase
MLGDSSRALEYHLLLSEIEKNNLKAENDRQLAELRVSFDSEKKEKDNQVLRQENALKQMAIQRKNVIMWLIFSVLLLTVVLAILIYSRFEYKRRENKELGALNARILSQNQQLDRLNKELEKASSDKDKILSIIAHELRNPLYWFQNLAEVLSKRFQDMSPDKMRRSLVSLDESAKNAFHLMDNLLQWSRSRLNRLIVKKMECELEPLIMETTRMYESIIHHKEIDFSVSLQPATAIYADPDLFTCVLRNLVSNAIKFTPHRGCIRIVGVAQEHLCQITVENSGQGIPPKILGKMFTGEDQLSAQGLMQEKGTGFGLRLCHEFTELNEGKIWVQDTQEGLTRFCFTIPVAHGGLIAKSELIPEWIEQPA